MNIEEAFFQNAIRGAKDLGHPVPQPIFGWKFSQRLNFQQSDDEATYSFNDEAEATIVSVVTFPNGLWYKASFQSLPEELKKLGWSNSAINMLRSASKFTRWVNHTDYHFEKLRSIENV